MCIRKGKIFTMLDSAQAVELIKAGEQARVAQAEEAADVVEEEG